MSLIAARVLRAFASRYESPIWIIESVLGGGDFELASNLKAAIDGVSATDIVNLGPEVDASLRRVLSAPTIDERARLSIVSDQITRALSAQRRRGLFTTAQDRPPPYDHPALQHLAIDSDGLVSLDSFEVQGDALCLGASAFFLLSVGLGSNAHYWLLEQFHRLGMISNVRVRLDPVLHGPTSELAGHFYRMEMFGRPLDWERIRNLREPEFGQWRAAGLSTKSLCTDYAWVPHDHEVDFLCEELPRSEDIDFRGSRYFHAVYSKHNDSIVHCDGAVRFYDREEFRTREKAHVRNAGKAGKRSKIFRIDAPVPKGPFGALVQSFFVWNYDVSHYFGANVPDGLRGAAI